MAERVQSYQEDDLVWRRCAGWLLRCGIDLSAESRYNLPGFAFALRDGVLLCSLMKILVPDSIDMSTVKTIISPNSKFTCHQNIVQVIKICGDRFGLTFIDLFQVNDLLECVHFEKVIRTLSLISRSDIARKLGIEGFSDALPVTENNNAPSRDYYNIEFDMLRDDAEGTDLREQEYASLTFVGNEQEDTYDKLMFYEPEVTLEDDAFKPTTKREYAISELLTTEKKYVKVLKDITKYFYIPLKKILPADDIAMIFQNHSDILVVNTGFCADLKMACNDMLGVSNRDSAATLGDPMLPRTMTGVFAKWKLQLAKYSSIIANTNNMKARLISVCRDNKLIEQALVDCEKRHGESLADTQKPFRLFDMFIIYFQHLMRYPLLMGAIVKELTNLTDRQHELTDAKEAMRIGQEIANFTNAYTGDEEMKTKIREIQNSISDFELPDRTEMSDYGRVLHDGVLRMQSHEDDKKIKFRTVFLFEKLLVYTRPNKDGSFVYKGSLRLDMYRLELTNNEAVANRSKFMTASGRWNFSWVLVDNSCTNVITFHCKSQASKDSWLEQFKRAMLLNHPSSKMSTNHFFLLKSFRLATNCDSCGRLLPGSFHEGFACELCSLNVHLNCIDKMFDCTHCKFLVGQLFRARVSNNNTRASFLSFHMDDVIRLLPYPVLDPEQQPPGFVMGVNEHTNRDGLFPLDSVDHIDLQPIEHLNNPSSSRALMQNLHHSLQLNSPRAIHRRPSDLPFERRSSSQSAISRGVSFTGSNGSGQTITTRTPSRPQSTASNFQTNDYINLVELSSYPWYAGSMGRDEAQFVLEGTENGTFMVRFSSKQSIHVVSISYNNGLPETVKHMKIDKDNVTGQVWLDISLTFSTIVELVLHFQDNSLRDCFHMMDIKLELPYKLAFQCIAVAQHDFKAEGEGLISLRKGDRVMVTDKTKADDTGWWRGKVGSKKGYFPKRFVLEEKRKP